MKGFLMKKQQVLDDVFLCMFWRTGPSKLMAILDFIFWRQVGCIGDTRINQNLLLFHEETFHFCKSPQLGKIHQSDITDQLGITHQLDIIHQLDNIHWLDIIHLAFSFSISPSL
jgi:hypothetical protein